MSEYLKLRERDRDGWIAGLRGPRNPLDPRVPYGYFMEGEPAASGGAANEAVKIATVLLTNRECPFRCLMCDLWRNTLEETVPAGAIPAQIRYALDRLTPADWLKLYNAGSFFDPAAIPPGDYLEIAHVCSDFERVLVECHPRMIGRRCLEFRDALTRAPNGRTRLEVAMGLETADPVVLERLNKSMKLDDFRRAAELLIREGITVRAFVLVRPPWHDEKEGVEWAVRSLEFAFDCGVETCTLIPTRAGNGAMERLAAAGAFTPPSLPALEAAFDGGLRLRRGRVLVDLWDLDRLSTCRVCWTERCERLRRANFQQAPLPPLKCEACG